MDGCFWARRSCKVFTFLLSFCFLMVIHVDRAVAAQSVEISPKLDFGGIIPLTPGSSTSLEVKTSGDLQLDFRHFLNVNLTVVLCIGEGTLSVELTKEDTNKDMMSMFVIGYPANPFIVPTIGITPGTISTSTVIDNTLGGFGIVFILSGVNSDAAPPHEYKLSLKLTAPAN